MTDADSKFLSQLAAPLSSLSSPVLPPFPGGPLGSLQPALEFDLIWALIASPHSRPFVPIGSNCPGAIVFPLAGFQSKRPCNTLRLRNNAGLDSAERLRSVVFLSWVHAGPACNYSRSVTGSSQSSGAVYV